MKKLCLTLTTLLSTSILMREMASAQIIPNAALPGAAEEQAAVQNYYHQHYAQAVSGFLSAANVGNTEAYSYLGYIYRFGYGVDADPRKAAMWFQKSVDAGDTADQVSLTGVLRLLGQPTPSSLRASTTSAPEPTPRVSQEIRIALQPAAQPQELQTAQQQAAQQAAQEESDRQQRIEQLKADIQQQEASAESWDRSAQDMENSNNNNCTTGGLGGLFCRGIGTAGIAKAKKEAAKARNQAAADQEEIERLQGLEVRSRRREDESFGGQFQQAAAQNDLSTQRIKGSAATAAGPGTSKPQEGSTQQDGSAQPTYQADRHYEGLDSNWVKTLLRQNGDWSCPTSLSQTNTATGFASQANNVCMRDSYVWAAVLEAWGAECESRFSRDQVAAQDATAMKGNLISAAKLCSNAPVFGPGPECGSAKIVDCKDLAPLKNQ